MLQVKLKVMDTGMGLQSPETHASFFPSLYLRLFSCRYKYYDRVEKKLSRLSAITPVALFSLLSWLEDR
ncbi:hypothetical protein CLV31_109134 [Algoriphagus aquaeductus]|uniref:Uncharacterized protein n=1 Tax=Algoriphagus aquaeductus TaxID=475299 RepID=A0A326RQH7_9BACT|nr:hypothetical protein CLV31_109134 [Algoriphagus aquaeductus]